MLFYELHIGAVCINLMKGFILCRGHINSCKEGLYKAQEVATGDASQVRKLGYIWLQVDTFAPHILARF